MATSIFISYRRGQSVKDARAIYERLRREFGADNVFMDLEGLAFGEDFVESLERHLAGCRVMLALIGPKWLTATDSQQRLRLDDPDDFVRIELRTALARPGVRVVPVLLDGAELPAEADLPDELKALPRRTAFSLRYASFDADMRQLCAGLAKLPDLHTDTAAFQSSLLSRRALGGAGTVAALVGVVGWATLRMTGRSPWPSDQDRDGIGRWAELTVGDVVQRLRWIEPGEFLMGSPNGETGFSEFEGPQHRVRISRGFWLADTACSQALWLAVMGGLNPAKFTDDPQNPVEQVSHVDVERFLATLASKLDHAAAPVLPTEAQWEYACRAGTTTAFSFGDTVTSEQVNYGNHPGGDAAKGLHRQRTLPVKALPANAWGLYQMHGNVWEWCADGMRPYTEVPTGQMLIDPTGPQEHGSEAARAGRGGSWLNVARSARSACRNADRRHFSTRSVGFRFALRS